MRRDRRSSILPEKSFRPYVSRGTDGGRSEQKKSLPFLPLPRRNCSSSRDKGLMQFRVYCFCRRRRRSLALTSPFRNLSLNIAGDRPRDSRWDCCGGDSDVFFEILQTSGKSRHSHGSRRKFGILRVPIPSIYSREYRVFRHVKIAGKIF